MPDEARPVVTTGDAGMFMIEVVGLVGIGRWGWHLGSNTAWSLALSAFFVAVAGAIWGVFRTRGFVPNGGEPVIAVPGPVRLAIEYGFYAAGAWGLWTSGWRLAAIVLVIGVIVVSLVLRDRVAGLLANRPPVHAPHRREDTRSSPTG